MLHDDLVHNGDWGGGQFFRKVLWSSSRDESVKKKKLKKVIMPFNAKISLKTSGKKVIFDGFFLYLTLFLSIISRNLNFVKKKPISLKKKNNIMPYIRRFFSLKFSIFWTIQRGDCDRKSRKIEVLGEFDRNMYMHKKVVGNVEEQLLSNVT